MWSWLYLLVDSACPAVMDDGGELGYLEIFDIFKIEV